MHIFYAPLLSAEGGPVKLDDDEMRHVKSRRLRPGEHVRLIDGAGGSANAVYKGADQCLAEPVAYQPEPATAFHLIQALLPAEKLDWALQKAVELGAAAITVFQPDRSSMGSRRVERTDRWERMIRESAKQCGQARFPTIQFQNDLAAALATPLPLIWMMDAAGARPVFAPPAPAQVALLVGPEGGWSPEERKCAVAAGAVSVRLGPLVLRSETVAAAGLALLQYGYGSEPIHSETNPTQDLK